ncbi:MAG TPA: hypothetical protein VFW06_01200 [Acidimicrobiia bacterium]|nr:hypothetical protein [Acidimicrobiia bacterium]
MLLWYTGVSVLLVANVFRSVGIDYRLVAGGALLPLVVDLPVGHRWFGHTLAFPVALLVVAMIGTLGRPRLLRRRLLCIPIGVFCGLILSGAFSNSDLFLWPLGGTDFGHEALLPAWWVVLLEELGGLVAWWWVVGQFDLYLPEPRAELFRTGRLQEGATP